ncbi:GIY-YIG nuclease family protein [Anaerobaca lacustris]|uniref:GIY-YIG nuclease family protein n=1 Tax=Anaerobaca lacustris TaxID=3044600 RepID=A0AAW6TTK7_9BACT|nr:GIY-YIG nuclease family protein [Sedimentisphaerales bacterium M17dextr]
MTAAILDAFDVASDGYSADRVVADPELNRRFTAECRQRGLEGSASELNRALLNVRKTGGLAGRPRSKQTHFADEDDYRFAAEIAVRFMERRDGISLDTIICDPEKAAQFDAVSSRIAPGYSPLQYRWAALNLRKSKRLEPELVGRIAPPIDVINVCTSEIVVDELPLSQGLYLFIAAEQLLYVGETENLRKRLKKHLEHSDNRGLARWIWEFGTESLHLEMHILADSIDTRIRRALELELIRSRRPLFNVKR